MMPTSQKIITKLRERRQIEDALRRMLMAGSDEEFRTLAQEIASLGPQVIPAIVGNLDRADARMLAAMGAVASLLNRSAVTTALRQVVLQPQFSDRGRIGAMTILERFLGQPSDDALMASMADPEGTAIDSLRDLLARAETNPVLMIEYIQGMDRQEPDVVLAVARALRDIGGPQAVEVLRMMAQDVRDEIAAEALQALGTLRLPEAVRALQTLIPISAPALWPLAERMLRKLQLAGVVVEPLPLPPGDSRALVSAVDGLGRQNVWFILQSPSAPHARFLNLMLSDRAGIVEAVGHSQVPIILLPSRQPEGAMHDVALPDASGALLMLEVPFDLGRRLVLESLANNRDTQIPIAGPLRLLSPWLWEYSGADSLPARNLPKAPLGGEASASRLLDHPAFASWTLRSEAILRAAEEIARRPQWDVEVWIRRLSAELFAEPAAAQALHRRLVAMSEWLLLAGDETRSQIALASAQQFLEKNPQDQAFTQTLVRRDLDLALRSLSTMSRPVLDTEESNMER